MKLILAFLLLITINLAAPHPVDGKISYDGYKVYKVQIENEGQREVLLQLSRIHKEEISIWHHDIKTMDILVNPSRQTLFKNITSPQGIQYYEMISDMQSLINEEQISADNLTDSSEFGWTRYHGLEDIEKFLDDILSKHPLVTEAFTLAQSYQGRTIRGIKITYKSGNPGVFIESHIHAYEWITSATATWFINELLTSEKEEVRNLADNYDWYIVPVLNVDGLVYTHEKDRLWRKTRQPVSHSSCIGTDGNRNYDTHWMENGGASQDPCHRDYGGPFPFSEPEVKGIADFLHANEDKLNLILAFHSYSQLLLSPYGHINEEVPPNYDDLMQGAKAYADAVGSLPYGTEYTYGAMGGDFYLASGSTIDYAYNEVGIKFGYTIEMRDKGKYGFVLPPIQILPNCEETLAGIEALVKEAKSLGYMEPKY